jgi:flagellar protein FliO/FliZ
VKPYRALTAAFAAASFCVLLDPVAALAAGTGKDLGENTPLNLPSDNSGQAASHVGGSGGSMARTFIGLAVVVAVIYGLTWVLRQMKKSSSSDGVSASGTGLTTEASLPLGPNRSVHLIRAGRELVLVGAAEHGITPIRTYTEDEALGLGLIEQPQLTVGDLIEGEAREVPTTAGGKARFLLTGALDTLRERTAR